MIYRDKVKTHTAFFNDSYECHVRQSLVQLLISNTGTQNAEGTVAQETRIPGKQCT